MPAVIDDTYAEAFRSIYAEFLITARDRQWLDHAVHAATGNASSTILCDCEAGLDRYVGPGGDESFATPDGRPGAIVQLHVPRFRKDRVEALERSAAGAHQPERAHLPDGGLLQPDRLARPTSSWAASSPSSATAFRSAIERFGRKCGGFRCSAASSSSTAASAIADGLMGGNLWFFGETDDAALAAAEAGVAAVRDVPGRHHAVSRRHRRQRLEGRQPVQVHDRQHLREVLPARCATTRRPSRSCPRACSSVMEIIINGRDLESIIRRHAGGDRRLGRTRPACCESRPATTAAGSARASSICIPTSSRRLFDHFAGFETYTPSGPMSLAALNPADSTASQTAREETAFPCCGTT